MNTVDGQHVMCFTCAGGFKSVGHLSADDLANIDSFIDKYVNGDIERFKMTAKQIVRMIRVRTSSGSNGYF